MGNISADGLGNLRHLGGWRPDLPSHRDHVFKVTRGQVARAPAAMSHRATCAPVADQGQLGSCTAHAGTYMLERLYNKVGRPMPLLSRLDLYWSTRVAIAGGNASDDSGATLRDTMQAMVVAGVALEQLWPYDVTQFAETPPVEATVEAKNHRATHYQRCPDLAAVMTALWWGYTVIGGFSVPENMMSDECARTGMVQYPGPDEAIVGGHAVHVVGYDITKGLIEFQNSWNAAWGDRGFGYLPTRFIDDGLMDDLWVAYNETMPVELV